MKFFNKKEDKKEKELDDLFDIENSNTNRTLIKAKIKSVLITTSISIIIILVVGFAFSVWKYDRFDKIRDNAVNEVEKDFIFTNPNRYMGINRNRSGFLSGDVSIGTYKIIEGKVIYTGDKKVNYNLIGTIYTASGNKGYSWNEDGENGVTLWSPHALSESVKKVNYYNELGQRKMIFFYPFIDYKELYRNEINNLDEIDNNKLAEMAISFDNYYSVDEVEDMIKGVRTTWYWIDILDQKAKEKLKNEEPVYNESQHGDTFIKPVMVEEDDDTIGIKLYNCQGQKFDNPVEEFCWELDRAAETSKYYSDIKSMLNVSVEIEGITKVSYDKSKLKIGGVVVTGTIEQLKTLKGKSFIKASTLGVVTDKY